MNLIKVEGEWGPNRTWEAFCPVCHRLNVMDARGSFKPVRMKGHFLEGKPNKCDHFQQLESPGEPSDFLFKPAKKVQDSAPEDPEKSISCTLKHPHAGPHKPEKTDQKSEDSGKKIKKPPADGEKKPEKKKDSLNTDFTFILHENGTKERPYSITIRQGEGLLFGVSYPKKDLNRGMKDLASQTAEWCRTNLKRKLHECSIETVNETGLSDKQISGMFLRAIAATKEAKPKKKQDPPTMDLITVTGPSKVRRYSRKKAAMAMRAHEIGEARGQSALDEFFPQDMHDLFDFYDGESGGRTVPKLGNWRCN